MLNPEGLIHSKRNIVNVAACMATTPTKNHEAVSNGSKGEKKNQDTVLFSLFYYNNF